MLTFYLCCQEWTGIGRSHLMPFSTNIGSNKFIVWECASTSGETETAEPFICLPDQTRTFPSQKRILEKMCKEIFQVQTDLFEQLIWSALNRFSPTCLNCLLFNMLKDLHSLHLKWKYKGFAPSDARTPCSVTSYLAPRHIRALSIHWTDEAKALTPCGWHVLWSSGPSSGPWGSGWSSWRSDPQREKRTVVVMPLVVTPVSLVASKVYGHIRFVLDRSTVSIHVASWLSAC